MLERLDVSSPSSFPTLRFTDVLPQRPKVLRLLDAREALKDARRRVVQREKVVPDRVWMRILTDTFDSPLVPLPGAVRGPLNALVRAYWWVASRLV